MGVLKLEELVSVLARVSCAVADCQDRCSGKERDHTRRVRVEDLLVSAWGVSKTLILHTPGGYLRGVVPEVKRVVFVARHDREYEEVVVRDAARMRGGWRQGTTSAHFARWSMGASDVWSG